MIVDTSVWVDALHGRTLPEVEDGLASGTLVFPPLVVAELISAAHAPSDRTAIGEWLQDLPIHPTGLEHWILVGDLRRFLAGKGVKVTISDAHIAQCAIDRDEVLASRDQVFHTIARHTALRLLP